MLNLQEDLLEAVPADAVDSALQDTAADHVALTTQVVVVVKGLRVAFPTLRSTALLEILSTE